MRQCQGLVKAMLLPMLASLALQSVLSIMLSLADIHTHSKGAKYWYLIYEHEYCVLFSVPSNFPCDYFQNGNFLSLQLNLW